MKKRMNYGCPHSCFRWCSSSLHFTLLFNLHGLLALGIANAHPKARSSLCCYLVCLYLHFLVFIWNLLVFSSDLPFPNFSWISFCFRCLFLFILILSNTWTTHSHTAAAYKINLGAPTFREQGREKETRTQYLLKISTLYAFKTK